MADTNTYDSFQKVEKWTTKEKFNAFDLSTIETGTEYNLAGQIDENDLGSDLQTKINGKLTAPTTPTAESAVTMLADGTVGTKPLSEIGKLYRHDLTIKADSYHLYTSIYISTNTEITAETLHNFISNDGYAHLGVTTQTSPATVVSFGGQTRDTWGILMLAGLSGPVYFVPTQVIDTVTEL